MKTKDKVIDNLNAINEAIVKEIRAEQKKEDFKLVLDTLSTYENLYSNKRQLTKGVTSLIAGMQLEAVVQIKNAINKIYKAK